jgi:tetratricopeptide (TPR) repeat protein/O-antigen ligase
MPARFARICDGIIEAGWLAAVILAPLFFNTFSSRIFEPDRISLIRSLALVILAAWLARAALQARLPDRAGLKGFFRAPWIWPALFLAASLLLSTLLSIAPRASWWGSYQRLQGAFSMAAYLAIFAALLANLRQRAQVERLLTTLVLTSLPITLYGLLQRFGLDPIQWGGDVSIRITSTLGNSIFIAAYLIMVFPLTVLRMIQAIQSLSEAGKNAQSSLAWALRLSGYTFIAILQVLAMYFSGSRGPALGWLVSVFFMALMFAVLAQKRWATLAVVGLTVLAALFLLVFNLEGGPLESLRSSPAIGRFGQLLNSESNSALVRRYIWEGAARLVAPHEPLVYPDGSTDRLNWLRPLVGYGPESMFVAYNPFYQPELGQVEKRNAAPDRSHNETWDSLVTGGLLGALAYLWLFGSLFYHGLKWLGLVAWPGWGRFLVGVLLAGGLGGGVLFSAWRGIEYLGIGIPFGLLLGLLGYIVLAGWRALAKTPQSPAPSGWSTPADRYRFFSLVALLAGLLAHFVEINFGISIGVTRLYFWVYLALLWWVGVYFPAMQASTRPVDGVEKPASGQPAQSARVEASGASKPGAKSRGRPTQANRKSARPAVTSLPVAGLVWGGLIGIILSSLGFSLITSQEGARSAGQVLAISLTQLSDGSRSLGVLASLVFSWLLHSLLAASEPGDETVPSNSSGRPAFLQRLAVTLLSSLAVAVLFWLWHSAGLASIARSQPGSVAEFMVQVARYGSELAKFYFYLFLLVFGIGWLLAQIGRPSVSWMESALPGQKTASTPIRTGGGLTALRLGALVGVFLAGWLIISANLRVVQADITFKLAESFNQPGAYPLAIEIYQRANQMAPNEDYYYLFLGRAYLEQARSLSDTAQQQALFDQAQRDLLTAQRLNPLNPDHTANLARVYSLWAAYTSDAQQQRERLETSDAYFSQALAISPNNVRLWNEWAYLADKQLDQPEAAQERLERALAIDPSYDWTYGQLGSLAEGKAAQANTPTEKIYWLEQAIDYYRQSIAIPGEAQLKYTYNLALGGALTQLERLPEAIQAYQTALLATPESSSAWRVHETLARLYALEGQLETARQSANTALSLAPASEQARLRTLLEQLNAAP